MDHLHSWVIPVPKDLRGIEGEASISEKLMDPLSFSFIFLLCSLLFGKWDLSAPDDQPK